MDSKLTLFSQIISKIDRGIFKKIVIEKKTDYRNKGFDSWNILILKYLKSIAKYNWQLSNLVAFIRLNIFVKINLQFWLDKPFDQPPESQKTYYQGVLF